MGINVVYFAPDPLSPTAARRCPATSRHRRHRPSRASTRPVPFKIPLTGLDNERQRGRDRRPAGQARADGATAARHRRRPLLLASPTSRSRRAPRLEWDFKGTELHNVTLANGPVAIGSPNLNDERTLLASASTKPGTYRLFCALHPVQMSERVVVDGKK